MLVVAEVLQAQCEGVPNNRLTTVVHLSLGKRELAWLIHYRLPVMLEPYLPRVETGMVQERRMSRWECRRTVPPQLFAYWCFRIARSGLVMGIRPRDATQSQQR